MCRSKIQAIKANRLSINSLPALLTFDSLKQKWLACFKRQFLKWLSHIEQIVLVINIVCFEGCARAGQPWGRREMCKQLEGALFTLIFRLTMALHGASSALARYLKPLPLVSSRHLLASHANSIPIIHKISCTKESKKRNTPKSAKGKHIDVHLNRRRDPPIPRSFVNAEVRSKVPFFS